MNIAESVMESWDRDRVRKRILISLTSSLPPVFGYVEVVAEIAEKR